MWLAFFLAKTLAFQHAIVNVVSLLADVVGRAARGVRKPSSTASGAPTATLSVEFVPECDDEAQQEGEADAKTSHSSLPHDGVCVSYLYVF
jgi:hypothetical protein